MEEREKDEKRRMGKELTTKCDVNRDSHGMV